MEEVIKIMIEEIGRVFIATASDECGTLAVAEGESKHDAVELCKRKVERRTTKNTRRRFVVEDIIYEA